VGIISKLETSGEVMMTGLGFFRIIMFRLEFLIHQSYFPQIPSRCAK